MKTAKFIIGLILILSLGFFYIGCDMAGNSGDDDADAGDGGTATVSPPTWIQGTWRYTAGTYWDEFEFTTDSVTFSASTSTADDNLVSTLTGEETSSDTLYSIEDASTGKYEWEKIDDTTIEVTQYWADGTENPNTSGRQYTKQ